MAVCLLPGTELSFSDEVRRVRLWPWSRDIAYDKAAIFRQVNQNCPMHHHDALEFPDGQIVLLTFLKRASRPRFCSYLQPKSKRKLCTGRPTFRLLCCITKTSMWQCPGYDEPGAKMRRGADAPSRVATYEQGVNVAERPKPKPPPPRPPRPPSEPPRPAARDESMWQHCQIQA
jgi:hypothetical protein